METINTDLNQTPLTPQPENTGMNQDTKTLIVIFLLVIAYPIGVILMFVWMKWPMWLKLLITLPTTLIFLAIFGFMLIGALSTKNSMDALSKINTIGQISKAQEATYRNHAAEIVLGITKYYARSGQMPWGLNTEDQYESNNILEETWFEKLNTDGDITEGVWDQLKLNNEILKLKKQINSDEYQVCFDSNAVSGQEICVP